METKTKAIIAVAALATAFAFGRYTTPVKIVEVTKTVEVEKKTDEQNASRERRNHKKIVETEITKPDGTKEKTTTITDESETTTERSSKDITESSRESESSKETVRGGGRVVVSVLYDPFHQAYGGSVSKEILGPINAGVFGLTNSSFGVSVGLSF